ncbi:MAG TPA: VOC family protein [Anaerolineales bacterium]|jgi:lactoylglutathione lyase
MTFLDGNLRGMQHLGLPVTDLERSQEFFLRLGFTTALRTDLHEDRGVVRVAMMEKDALTIELYQLPGVERDEIASRHDGHIDHIALDVRDIDWAYAELKAAGFEILEADAPVFLPFWSNGVKFFTVRGPDGEKVEFNQRL